MTASLQTQTPEEELRYWREVLLINDPARLLDRVVDSFNVLQTRSALLLSLITLCLTISGFSGHRIAAAGPRAAGCLALGLALSVVSAVLLLRGPLRLRWATRLASPEGLDATVVALIRQRDLRTRAYHRAAAALVAGLASYTASLILFILLEGGG